VSDALSAVQGAEFLASYGLPLVPQTLARTPDDAALAAASFGGRTALKLIAKGLSHKTEVGGVRLDLPGPSEVREAAADLLAAGRRLGDPGAAVLVQPMARGVAEMIVGITDDPTFGPVVVVGFGGTLTELFKDIAVGVPPLSRADAEELISTLRSAALLAGYRGSEPADRNALVDLVLGVARIAADGKVKELDLNPVIVGPVGAGCVVVDNRVIPAESRGGR
jgi:acyl-CoA synthetase (NDP forming)